MQINDELIEYLEGLSKLSLSVQERAEISAQLQEFLEYTDMLSELDFAADSCADFLSAADNHLRPDEAQPSMPVEEIMKNAPKRQGDFFSVPKAIE